MIPFQHGAFGVAGYASDFELIETQTVGAGGQASITFSSIPQTYKHLQIRMMARATGSFTYDDINAQFNGDSASNYSYHRLFGNGSSANSDATAPSSFMPIGRAAYANAAANLFGVSVADILDYANTTKYKTVRAVMGVDGNGSGDIWLNSGSWRNTNAITSIVLNTRSGNWAQYSSFALYGEK